jgi:pimeloyl-ACP methyl ester carboxylesterase
VRQALQGAKAAFDPDGLMNPGVLIDPRGRDVGINSELVVLDGVGHSPTLEVPGIVYPRMIDFFRH